MEYIQKIRVKVDHEKILIPTSAIVILNEEDHILLHLRNDSNSWGLPGGLMDLGETAVESVKREAFEETGLTINNPQLFGIFSGPNFEAKYPNGDETSSICMGFFTKDFHGNMNKFHQMFINGFLEYRFNGSSHPVLY